MQEQPIYFLQGWRHTDGMNFISGLFTELGNLHSNDRLHKATAEGFAGSQREMHNKINLEAEYRSVMQGQTKP